MDIDSMHKGVDILGETERGIYRDELWQKDDGELVYSYYIPNEIGTYIFSIDKKRAFNFWTNYPEKLTKEELIIFNKENPVMAKLRDGDKYLAKLTGDDSYLIDDSEG